MYAFIKFNKGLLKLPLRVQLFLALVIAANMIVPLFFLSRLEAQVVLGAFMASFVLMVVLTSLVGFTRLLGLGHIFWFPMLYFLWPRLGQFPVDDVFGIWLRLLIGLNVVALALDILDVIRYIRGDRAEMVQGLS